MIASLATIELIDSYEEELNDRFGLPPDEVVAVLQRGKRIRCLTEEANFDLIETKGTKLMLRHTEGKEWRADLPPSGQSVTKTKGKKKSFQVE